MLILIYNFIFRRWFIIDKDKLEILEKMAQSGDENAQEEMLRMFEGYIYTIASGYYIKDYDMDDLIQLGRMSVYKAMKLYDFDSASRGFMYYAMNAVKKNFMNEFRKCGKYNYEMSLNEKNKESEMEYIDAIKDDINIEDDYEKKIMKNKLTKAVKALPGIEKDIIIWKFYFGRSLKEYAALHNMNYSCVRYHEKAALKKLQCYLINE